MKRHWKKIVAAIAVLAALVIGGSFIYAKVINKADPEFAQDDVDARLDAATTTSGPLTAVTAASTDPGTASTADPPSADPATTAGGGQAAASSSVDGVWTIEANSEVGYRVKESINGFDTTANGRTKAIEGSMTIDGTTISQAEFTVDMTTFTSDESRRDSQFRGRVMDAAHFPEATFVLTTPIELQQIPGEGGSVTATATGDLTLRGTTHSVSFDVQGTFKNGLIGVLGQIPVVFADYGIPNPSTGTVRTEDNGVLEFVLVLQKT